MIYPRKSARFEWFFEHYLTFIFKKHFYRVYLDTNGVEPANGPVLVLLNHSNWWDGLVSFYLNRRFFKKDSYAMMSESGISAFPFFQKIGAFSVNPTSPKEIIESLRYSEQLCKEGKYVWIFPQGKEEHLEKRPIQFMNGPAYLIEKVEKLQVQFVSLYYTFTHDQRPELYIRLLPPIDFITAERTRKQITLDLERMMTRLLDELKHDIVSEKTDSFSILLTGRKTASEWLQIMKRPFSKEGRT